MKTSGLRDMKKGRSAPSLSLVPHSTKYGNDPDEIDPAHILPLPPVNVREIQFLHGIQQTDHYSSFNL